MNATLVTGNSARASLSIMFSTTDQASPSTSVDDHGFGCVFVAFSALSFASVVSWGTKSVKCILSRFYRLKMIWILACTMLAFGLDNAPRLFVVTRMVNNQAFWNVSNKKSVNYSVRFLNSAIPVDVPVAMALGSSPWPAVIFAQYCEFIAKSFGKIFKLHVSIIPPGVIPC